MGVYKIKTLQQTFQSGFHTKNITRTVFPATN